MFSFLFDKKTGALHKEGDILRRPIFAQTLKELANSPDPVDLFYRGNMAKIAVEEIRSYSNEIFESKSYPFRGMASAPDPCAQE